jgi:CHAD domain-containing protein
MRVGVRRMRSGLTLYRDVLPADQSEPLRQELRWLADELGRARDLDVFADETLALLRRRFPDDPQLKRIADETAQMRAEAQQKVRGCLDSLRYAELTLRLGAWLEGRAWRQQPTTPSSARLFLPARDVARTLLARRHRKLRRRGSHLSQRSEHELHALRIEAKKLRFAAEFTRSLFPGTGAGRFVRRVRRLQDTLGHLSDTANARDMLARVIERLGPEVAPETQRAAGFVEGWISHAAEDELSRLPRRWKALRSRKPFWRKD